MCICSCTCKHVHCTPTCMKRDSNEWTRKAQLCRHIERKGDMNIGVWSVVSGFLILILYVGLSISQTVPFFFLVGILETVWDKHSVTAATPPPSPTSGESGMVCCPLWYLWLNVVRVSAGNCNSESNPPRMQMFVLSNLFWPFCPSLLRS